MAEVIVDGANLAHEERTGQQKPRAANLIAVQRAFEERGYEVTTIVDASLIHEIDDPDQLDALIEKGRIKQVPARTDADYFILQIADERGALVASNDLFKQWREQYPWVEERRVPVMIVDGEVHIYEPGLERGDRADAMDETRGAPEDAVDAGSRSAQAEAS